MQTNIEQFLFTLRQPNKAPSIVTRYVHVACILTVTVTPNQVKCNRNAPYSSRPIPPNALKCQILALPISFLRT